MYGKAVSKLYKIYHSPLRILNCLKNYLTYIIEVQDNNKYTIRVIDKKIKNKKFILKIQIINSRASYNAFLSDVISNYPFMSLCEPLSLIKIGYYSKIEETHREISLNNKKKYHLNLMNFILKKSKNKTENQINVSIYWYSFISIFIENNEIKVRLLILKAKSIFDVPILDLIEDKSLLENIYPPDLVRIGYDQCQLEAQENHISLFGA